MSAVLMASDSRNVIYQTLSAKVEIATKRTDFEAARKKNGMTQAEFARLAGVSLPTYARALAAPASITPRVLASLEAAVRRLGDGKPADARRTTPASDERAVLTRSLYRLVLGHVAREFGVCADAVMRQDHRRGATADPHYRRLATARQATIYIINTEIAADAVRQRRLAELLGMTPAGVCLAIRSIENRRDDEEFDALIRRVERLVSGGE